MSDPGESRKSGIAKSGARDGHDNSEGKATAPLPFFRLETLKKRSEFKDAAGGPRYSTKSFTMLRRIVPESGVGIRFGFTVTKKVGNSVERNRIRRRLREAVRKAAPGFPPVGMDLVILARRDAISLDFVVMVADIARAVAVLATRGESRKGASPAKNPSDNGNLASS